MSRRPAAARSSRCPGRRDWHGPTSRSRLTAAGSSRAPDAGVVRVWNTDTGKGSFLFSIRHARTDAPVRAVIGVDVSRDGSRLATAGADGSARIFDAATGRGSWSSSVGATAFRAAYFVVNRAVFSPDGSAIATTGWDATVRTFDAAAPVVAPVLRGTRQAAGHVTRSRGAPAVRLLSTGADGTHIWDARTGGGCSRF